MKFFVRFSVIEMFTWTPTHSVTCPVIKMFTWTPTHSVTCPVIEMFMCTPTHSVTCPVIEMFTWTPTHSVTCPFIEMFTWTPTHSVTYPILTSECNQEWWCLKIHKIGFRGKKNIQNGAKCPLQRILHSHTIYTLQACLLITQNFLLYFDAGVEHVATRSRGNGANINWLR